MHDCLRSLIAFIISISIASNIYSQEFGGNPPAVKWNQINTDTARVIFPAGLEIEGKRVAAIVHNLQKEHNATIGNKLKKINIVLQNQPAISNGYVALGPYRSEFYLFAPQNSFRLGVLNWVDNLALHEYRHVQQYNNFNVGLSKVAGVLFGQQARALANAAAVPDWFFEGDAVFNETVLSEQGRGRLPAFFNGYQSLYRQKKQYNFMKLRNGSLRNYVPDHYQLGYLLVGYGRQKYGADFWKKVSYDAAQFKPLIYPWQGAIKKHAGIPYRKFVSDALAFYDQNWQQRVNNDPLYITPASKGFVADYKYPYLAANGSLVVLKSTYRQVPAFYRIGLDGIETKLATRDIANDDYFSYKNERIVYASFKADKRWGYLEYSNIKLLDLKNGETKKITHKARLFSPDVSSDGQMVVAVEMQTNQQSNIVVLTLNGQTEFKTKHKAGIVYTHPKFSADDRFIYTAMRQADGKMALLKIDPVSGGETALIPFSNSIIGFPTVQGDTIFFTSTYKGSDESWAYVESKKTIYRVASNPTGYYQSVYNATQKKLIASNFTADGYRLAAIDRSAILWKAVDRKDEALPDIYIEEALQQEKNTTLQNIPARDFLVGKYKKSYNIFNFHSWRPYYDNPEISISLLGENILNTLQTELTYTYNRNESSHRAGVNAIYGAWYLQPVIGVNQTWSRNVAYNTDTTFYYNELNANAGLRLPLNFSSGKQFRYLTLSGSINHQQVNWKGLGKNLLRDLNFNYWEGTLQYSGQIQKAVQQIYPRWAQVFLLRYRSIINKYSANQLLASGTIYLPALHPTHNLVLTGAYQQRDTLNQYTFSNSFPFSRGYSAVDFPRMWRFGSNYHFPLFYPDFGVANIVYFKRIRANAFYDVTHTKSLRTGTKYNFSTVGGELFFDTKWWNQEDVSFGFRFSHLLNKEFRGLTQPNQWEVILPVGLFR